MNASQRVDVLAGRPFQAVAGSGRPTELITEKVASVPHFRKFRDQLREAFPHHLFIVVIDPFPGGLLWGVSDRVKTLGPSHAFILQSKPHLSRGRYAVPPSSRPTEFYFNWEKSNSASWKPKRGRLRCSHSAAARWSCLNENHESTDE